jgi:hypothetical protein
MIVRAFDQIRGAVCDPQSRVPAKIQRILAEAKLAPPPQGETIPLPTIDAALRGMSIDRRLEIKAALRAAGLIN